MNLIHLCSAPHVTVYFDSWNNWLYLEWDGRLTLSAVQQACLAVATCFVSNVYPRVLNNNANVSSVEWDVAPWLTKFFLPHLGVAGVEQIAWVHAPGPRERTVAEQSFSHLRTDAQVVLMLFADLEDAVHWLQQTRPEYVSGCALLPRPAAADAKLLKLVRRFEQEIAASDSPPTAF